jgi:hypothetical protein
MSDLDEIKDPVKRIEKVIGKELPPSKEQSCLLFHFNGHTSYLCPDKDTSMTICVMRTLQGLRDQ